MNDDILYHQATITAAEQYLSNPAQVLAVIGQENSGADSLAISLAASLLDTDSQKVLEHPGLIRVLREEDKQDIAIETVRGVIGRLKVKAGGRGVQRVVLIDSAQTLSLPAQNALLKTLEQPNPDTVFIMVLDSPSGVLPTVMSRASKLLVHPVGLDRALARYAKQHGKAKVTSAWNVSEGAAQLLHDLLDAESNSNVMETVEAAKKFLAGTRYQRMLAVDELSKSRPRTIEFVEALSKILKALHHSRIKQGIASGKLLEARKRTEAASNALSVNASPKLVLSDLVLNLEV